MTIEKQKLEQKSDGVVITIDRKFTLKQKFPTQRPTDPTPVERWLQETLSEQPWTAFASFDFDSSWAECTSQPREESLMVENGSVDDGK